MYHYFEYQNGEVFCKHKTDAKNFEDAKKAVLDEWDSLYIGTQKFTAFRLFLNNKPVFEIGF